jgi:hypothetical protein
MLKISDTIYFPAYGQYIVETSRAADGMWQMGISFSRNILLLLQVQS